MPFLSLRKFLPFSLPSPIRQHFFLSIAAGRICALQHHHNFHHQREQQKQQMGYRRRLLCGTSPSTSSGVDLSSKRNANKLLCALSSIPKEELGASILHSEANRSMQKIVLISKAQYSKIRFQMCSLGSSAFGLVMIPLITSSLWEPIADRPAVAVFAGVANAFLLLFAFTPILLHLLTKRFVQNVFFNQRDQMFTTVHYNFFLQKRALRFTADQLPEGDGMPQEILASYAVSRGCLFCLFWIDAAELPKDRRFWLPLATCLAHSYPMLLPLDANCYNDQTAFKLLTKNIKLPTEENSGEIDDEDDRR